MDWPRIVEILLSLAGGGAIVKLFDSLLKERADLRDDKRDGFDRLSNQQAQTIQRLDERLGRLEEELDRERQMRISLQSDVARFKTMYQLMRQVVLTNCPKEQGIECPLWKYLDDRERDELVASLVAEKG